MRTPEGEERLEMMSLEGSRADQMENPEVSSFSRQFENRALGVVNGPEGLVGLS